MKKITSLICIIAFALTGCSGEVKYDNKELVDNAAALHTSLESAHIKVIDDTSGDPNPVQEITYRFAGDVMQYMYIGYDEEQGKTYYEFNNGTELNTKTVPDDTEWTFFAKGSEGYYTYSRSSRHYFADGAKLFNDYEAAVSMVSVAEADGEKVMKIEYDLEKLGSYASLADYGSFSDFSMEYCFGSDGFCNSFTNKYTLSDGTSYSYTILIEKRDESLPIERAG